jgi:hypothetical protein
MRIATLVMNHGSPQVQQLLEEWGEIVRKIENADATIQIADSSRSPSPELERASGEEVDRA